MPKKFTQEQIVFYLESLADTAPRIARFVQGWDEARLQEKSAVGEWSVVQNLAHIRACADVWGYTIYVMLMEDAPVMVHIHPRDWMKMQGYAKQSFQENFEAFVVIRKQLLHQLTALKFEDFARTCTFSNRANTFDIFMQTERMANHELGHCTQIEAIRH